MSRIHAIQMPLPVAHLASASPQEIQATNDQAINALRTVFAQARGHFVNPQGTPFDIQVHTTQEAALATLGQGAKDLAVNLRSSHNALPIWLTVQDPDAPNDPTQANVECAFSGTKRQETKGK